MKKLFTIFCFALTLVCYSQAPVIEGIYFPVRNTAIKQVWDTTGFMMVPTIGINQVWDYRFSNGQFLGAPDTVLSKFIDPVPTPYDQFFPQANQATFIRTPFRSISDSLYYYFKVTQQGTYVQGGRSIKKMFDSTMIHTKPEFYLPSSFSYLQTFSDTAYYTSYAKRYKIASTEYLVKLKSRKIKTVTYVGYGSLKLPNNTYNNVALVKETYALLDSIFVDFASTGNYTYFMPSTSSGNNYSFYRNNTFGSAYLGFLSANPGNTNVEYGWYTLPVNIGSISGKVFTNTLETTPVTSGEMYLYRENSNFSKNDILAKTNLDAMGNYKFDSIPYGEYRIAVRPNYTLYPNSKITYYGDTTNWIDATSIITTTTTSLNNKIHLLYSPIPVGVNTISGQIGLDLSIFRTSAVMAIKPIGGVGIVIKKNPGSSAERVLVTDTAGKFNIGNLNNGAYKMFVDIPGLHMAGTYNFTVTNGTVVNGLDFTAGTDSIHPNSSAIIGIKENKKATTQYMNAYPNPYSTFATIVVNNPETSTVVLEVYNTLGQKVQILDNSQKQAGIYKYTFSAKSLNLSSGMYFVKLTTGNKTNVLKLIEN